MDRRSWQGTCADCGLCCGRWTVVWVVDLCGLRTVVWTVDCSASGWWTCVDWGLLCEWSTIVRTLDCCVDGGLSWTCANCIPDLTILYIVQLDAPLGLSVLLQDFVGRSACSVAFKEEELFNQLTRWILFRIPLSVIYCSTVKIYYLSVTNRKGILIIIGEISLLLLYVN